MSNTCAFYNKGWRGINIEPNPISFKAFRKHRPLDININLAIDKVENEVLFNCLEELSGIDDESYLFKGRKTHIKQCRVKAVPLNKILSEHVPKDIIIDFMSVDCEGHDIEVLLSNDWTVFRPRALLVEDHGERSPMLHKALEAVGYIFEKKMGFTKIFFPLTGASPRM
jgi:FkbM family methyltransferase